MMESTPVCGVESRNDSVAARLPPCRLRDAPTGITPQEHSGNGTPNSAALNTGLKPRLPRWASSQRGETQTDSTPATRKPSSRYGAICAVTSQVACRMSQATVMTDPGAAVVSLEAETTIVPPVVGSVPDTDR
jgi:hypothetical protein